MIKILSILLLITSCSSKKDEDRFLDILENKYANIEVNKKEKLLVLGKIRSFVKEGNFKSENIKEIQSLLAEMKDYHLVMDSTEDSSSNIDSEIKPCITSKVQSDDTFSIQIHSLWCETPSSSSFDRFRNEFKEHASKAKEYKNLVIDLRNNGGGGDQETRYLLQRLIKERSFLYEYQYTNATQRIYKRSFGKWAKKQTDYIEPIVDAVDYLGKKNIIALIDRNTFSSAEVVASVLKFSKSAELIGETTKGGAGDPISELFFDGKYELTYATCVVWQEDGSLYEQHGVTPSKIKK